jgi:hypothetical protein
MQGARPAAVSGGGDPKARSAWRLPVRARILVVAGVLLAAASVFVAVFRIHGVWVPLCSGGRAACDAVRWDERLAIRALVVAVGVTWAASLGLLALVASRGEWPGEAGSRGFLGRARPVRGLRPRDVAGSAAGRRSGAAPARGR